MLKILQVHNRYQAGLGGEDTVVAEEQALLQQRGHDVEQLIATTQEGDTHGGMNVALTGVRAIWSASGYQDMTDALRRHRPDIVHVHNTFPLLSPSVYWAAHRFGVPVVQTLHNYRLTCANGLLLRGGEPCESCVGGFPVAALRHRCYKNSLAATSAVVGMQMVNRVLGSYSSQVDAYIALTRFAKGIMVRAGLPETQIHVKPNFIAGRADAATPSTFRHSQIVFVGRIAPEKGLDLLLNAWAALGADRHRLVVVGDGPQRRELQARVADDSSIEWRGWLDRRDVLQEIRQSQYLVLPSRWYEGFPMVLLEALCAGTPVIVSRLGALPEIIGEGLLGATFEAGNAAALRETLEAAFGAGPEEWREKSAAARKAYCQSYTPEVNYKQLIDIYGRALRWFHRRESDRAAGSVDPAAAEEREAIP